MLSHPGPHSTIMDACRICGGLTLAPPYVVRERMYGSREPFDYRRCEGCGSLSIVDVPADLSRHYPADYYSFAPQATVGIVDRVKQWRDAGHLPHALGLRRRFAGLAPNGSLEWLPRLQTPLEARILDVGTGGGGLLRQLAAIGYRNLVGIDPFLSERAAVQQHGFSISRESLEGLAERVSRAEVERFDLVMLHHVIEHHERPPELLRAARRVLAPGGRVLVRTPLADSWAAEYYGQFWVQHDAPRHLALFTSRGMAMCAAAVALRVADAWCDSQPFQIWGSEAYRSDRTLADVVRGRRKSMIGRLLDRDERTLKRRVRELNLTGRGDQGAFVLVPV